MNKQNHDTFESSQMEYDSLITEKEIMALQADIDAAMPAFEKLLDEAQAMQPSEEELIALWRSVGLEYESGDIK